MKLFEVDESSKLPIWIQLRNRVIYLIKTGYFKPGDQLPSVRAVAAASAINYNTVSKVYVDLEHSGYVKSVRGRGVFVLELADLDTDDVQSIADVEIEDCIRRCLSLGMSIDEVKLRMMDIAYKVQQETTPKDSLRRGLHERAKAQDQT